MKDFFKVGDALEYIGPARDIYTNPKSHPSAYKNYRVVEINNRSKWMHPDSDFARVECEEIETGVKCGGSRHLNEKEWKKI